MVLGTAGRDGQAPGPIDSDEYACNAPCGDRVLNSAPSANKVRVHSVGADGKKPSGEEGQGSGGEGAGQGWDGVGGWGARCAAPVWRWREGSVAGQGRGRTGKGRSGRGRAVVSSCRVGQEAVGDTVGEGESSGGEDAFGGVAWVGRSMRARSVGALQWLGDWTGWLQRRREGCQRLLGKGTAELDAF